jgi:hypothetical protein
LAKSEGLHLCPFAVACYKSKPAATLLISKKLVNYQAAIHILLKFAITQELGIQMNLLRKWLPEFEQEELSRAPQI